MNDAQRTSIELAAFAIANVAVVRFGLSAEEIAAVNLTVKAAFSYAWNKWKPKA